MIEVREVKREFVMMPIFDKQWKEMGLNDTDLQLLQEQLLQNPQAGKVIRGTGKLRKMRFAFGNKGKSGSSRVLYVDFVIAEAIYLIFAYPKSEKDNLSKEEINHLRKLIDQLEKNIKEML